MLLLLINGGTPCRNAANVLCRGATLEGRDDDRLFAAALITLGARALAPLRVYDVHIAKDSLCL